MASVEKFTAHSVVNELRHIERTIMNPSNKDIDPSRTNQNYSLAPDRGVSSYDYFKKRMSELYCYQRDDVKVMAGWIVTAPKDLAVDQYNAFFQSTHNFLIERYGEDNCIQSIVHCDESGQDHLHFYFIPVTKDLKHLQGEKVCACEILNREELRNFHPALQKHLLEDGIICSVQSGITKAQGGNRSVRELKHEREITQQRRLKLNRTIERGRW